MDYRGKIITVMGLGLSGYSAARLLVRLGAKVFISDSSVSGKMEPMAAKLRASGVDIELGGHTNAVYLDADEIVLSPGIPVDIPILNEARNLRPEIELGFRFLSGKIIGITGSNGKSTVASLAGAIFEAAGTETFVVGNVGIPICDVALETTESSLVCAELSSFQLEAIVDFRPDVSCMLNLSPDHLRRHGTVERYYGAKARIFENQTKQDCAVLPEWNRIVEMLDINPAPRRIYFGGADRGSPRVFVSDGDMRLRRFDGSVESVLPVGELGIRGPHNLENACAAVACTIPFELPSRDIADVLRDFRGLPHRLEFVANIDGVDFVNDSKATNVDSLGCALLSFDRSIILIAGGYDKGADFSILKKVVKDRVKHLILIGDTASKIETDWLGAAPIERTDTLEDAVRSASDLAVPGDTILLSPGCASFDMFEDFERRGDRFREIVMEIKGSPR